MSAATFASEAVLGWGMAIGGQAQVCRPRTVDELAAVLTARDHGPRGLALRGSGCS
ncbi:MAG: hypothetical protein HZB39_15410 [Planctomycetes bacterium]|nr:hypothetical protein [Planctomycetota bacterium]